MLPVLKVGCGDKEKFLFFFLCVFPHPSSGVVVSVAQLCLILCDRMDCSPPGSSVHGMFKATILEWVSISSSRGSSQPRDLTRVSCVSCIN